MKNRTARPKIPSQTERELWARAAGRCEFRGCNKLLYKDGLTQQRSNLGQISHIVAYSPNGPRGDPIRSKLLEKEISNLMLTCREHGKIVDDQQRVAEYSEDRLLEFKREHEQRVRMLTEIREDAQTHVLLFQASIDTRQFEINQTAAFRAILPQYPAEEDAMIIDLTGMAIPAVSEEFFRTTAASVTAEIGRCLRRRPYGSRIKTLSVFALAPVPLLVHLGYLLGDINHVDLYQRHRGRQDWRWGDEEEAQEFYNVVKPAERNEGQPIAVLLSVSSSIDRNEVAAAIGQEPFIYEIRAREPGLDFLRSRKRLELFGYETRQLLEEIHERHSHTQTLHLFAATPAPVAIEFGRNIKQFHPPFVVYEYRKADRTYIPALEVNARSEGNGHE